MKRKIENCCLGIVCVPACYSHYVSKEDSAVLQFLEAAVGVQFVFPESIILTSYICLQTTANTLKRPDEVFC